MSTRRPGAPRETGRPVSASRSGRSRRDTGPSSAPRPRTTKPTSRTPAQDGPVLSITRRTLVLVCVIVVALATLVPTLNTYIAQRQQLHALQEQVSGQESDIDDLQAQVDRWDDPTYVAAQARERLLYAMPGETQYRLMDTSGHEVPRTEHEREHDAPSEVDWFSALWTSVEGASGAEAPDDPDVPPADGKDPSQ